MHPGLVSLDSCSNTTHRSKRVPVGAFSFFPRVCRIRVRSDVGTEEICRLRLNQPLRLQVFTVALVDPRVFPVVVRFVRGVLERRASGHRTLVLLCTEDSLSCVRTTSSRLRTCCG